MRTRITCLLGAALIALAGCGSDAERASDPVRAEAKKPATQVDRDARTIRYEGRDGETALELLREHGYDVTVEESRLGAYVTAIGDVPSTKSRFWLFTVDGEMPSVGADKLVTRDGQQVEWRYGS